MGRPSVSVLVVEDEPVIRMILHDYLSGEGYHVLVAEDGEQAFKILASKPHLDLMVTDFRLRETGFERMLVLAPQGTTDTRAGRISQRLLELETYRLMALRGLPVAKAVGAQLGQAERELADITTELQSKTAHFANTAKKSLTRSIRRARTSN